MWNLVNKLLMMLVFIFAVGIYVSYSTWSVGAGMVAGQLMMILIYEIFIPYMNKELDKLDKFEEENNDSV